MPEIMRTCVRILIYKDDGECISDTSSPLNADWKNHLKVLHLPGWDNKLLIDLKRKKSVSYEFDKHLVEVSLFEIEEKELVKLTKEQLSHPSSPSSEV